MSAVFCPPASVARRVSCETAAEGVGGVRPLTEMSYVFTMVWSGSPAGSGILGVAVTVRVVVPSERPLTSTEEPEMVALATEGSATETVTSAPGVTGLDASMPV